MKIIDVPQAGKCGLAVAYPGRYGLIRRAWTVPANPRTAAQQIIRGNLAATAADFKALTPAKQDAWNAAAATVQSRARLGQSGPLTGLQLFVKLNAVKRQFGQATIDAPTPRPTFAPNAPQGLVVTNVGGVIALKLTCPGDPGDNTVVRACKAMGSGVRRIPQLSVLGPCPQPEAGACDITAEYTAKFGAPAPGTRVFVSVGQHQDGWLGPETTFTALVPAAA